MTSPELAGMIPSWIDKDNNYAHYTTNCGGVGVKLDTGEFVDCCFGLGRNYGNKELSIHAHDGEMAFRYYWYSTVTAELATSGYPYKDYKAKQSIEIMDILNIIHLDDNYSIAAGLVKRQIIITLLTKFQLSRKERQGIGQLVAELRKPIREADIEKPIERKPIIFERTPIFIC